MVLAPLVALLLLTGPGVQEGTPVDLPSDQGLDPALVKELGRFEPSQDGWNSEVLAGRVGELGRALGVWMLGQAEAPASLGDPLVCRLPEAALTWKQTGAFGFARLVLSADAAGQALALGQARDRFTGLLDSGFDLVFEEAKVIELQSAGEGVSALLSLAWVNRSRTIQAIAQVRLSLLGELDDLSVLGLDLQELQLARRAGGVPLMGDLGVNWIADHGAREQLTHSLADLRATLDARLGVGLLGHHGLALGDLDRDGLEDIYVCQPGGLPNLLLMRDHKGEFQDRAAELGIDFCDPSRSALLLDLDGDGWQDLVLAAGAELYFFWRQPGGTFVLKSRASAGYLTSLAAADFDGDQDLDIFACGYLSPYQGQQVPQPYHDAKNGAANFLFSNLGGFEFEDVTQSVGLAADNQRFTFCASFWDFDEDGDQDILVVNDFGANQLWRNDRGHFVDVAKAQGVEDVAAGMGCSLGDVNGDGHEDLFVSNMFSAAGRRIAAQEKFRQGADAAERRVFLRHAQGNSLFLGQGGAPLIEVPGAGGAQMGRWAWGGIFCDLDLDGRRDLYVPAGFVTGQRPDDL
jgi:hypothetical protein